MLLFIVRHGDPIYDPDSLTPKGHLQAKALAKRFGMHGLDKIYSSPLIRAQQTAQPTAELLGLPIEIEEWTSESLTANTFYVERPDGFRSWIFHQNPTVLKNDASHNMIDNWYEADCFKGYDKDFKGGYERIQKASDEFLARHGYERDGSIYKITKPNDDRIAVFCHQGFGVTWLSHLIGIPPHLFWTSFDFSHSGVTVLAFRNYQNGLTVPQCLQLSDLSHIFADRLPFKYNNSIDL